MGIKLDLYNDVKDRILDKVPAFLTVRKWNNQVQNEDKESAWEYPACFIGFSEILWEGGLPKTANKKELQAPQMGLITLTLYCVFEDKQEETDAFTDYEPTIQMLWYYLHQYQKAGSNWGALERVAEREDNNHNNVIVWEIDFRCPVQDYAACDLSLTEMVPAPTISITPSVSITNTTEGNIRTAAEFDE